MKYKLTKQNASCIMGHINNYFGLPTVIDYGMQERIIRSINPETFKTSYNKEFYRNIIPQLSVNCKWHPMLKDNCESFRKNAPLLFVSSMYAGSGICIHVGDIIEFKGSELSIKSIHDMKKLKFKKPHINKFKHMIYSDEIKEKELKNLLDRIISDYNWNDYDYYNYDYKAILKYLDREFSDMLYSGSNSIIIDHWITESRKYVLKLVKNIDAFIKYGGNPNNVEDVFYFELISEENENVFIKSSSLYDIGSYLYGVYKDNHPEEDEEGTDNYNSDGYEYYDWSSGF